jgi:glycerate kinase
MAGHGWLFASGHRAKEGKNQFIARVESGTLDSGRVRVNCFAVKNPRPTPDLASGKPLCENVFRFDMKILLAADSFKDALPASEVCQALARGIRAAWPDANIQICPLADGGEGTAESLREQLGLLPVQVQAADPLGRPMPSAYLCSADGRTVFVEMARTAGLQILPPDERNPLLTSTLGMGQQVSDALRRGAQRLVLAIGGSATNDAGIGMATALGWRFLGKNNNLLDPIGKNLIEIHTIIPPIERPSAMVQVICDVTNPLFGPTGAAYVYARQKGADEAAIAQLDAGMRHFAAVAARHGYSLSPDAPGSGAAGGMGYGTRLFLGATLHPGADLVMDLLDFDKNLANADLVLTGEGMIDAQTAHGKLVQRLCRRAIAQGVPVVAFCGRLEATEAELRAIGLQAAFCINAGEEALPLPVLLGRAAANLERTAHRVFTESSLIRGLLP